MPESVPDARQGPVRGESPGRTPRVLARPRRRQDIGLRLLREALQRKLEQVYVKVGETVDTFFASVIGHGNFDVSASAAASSTGGTGSFVFAGDTACDAIKISNGQDDFTQGAVWSNGGITTSGKPNTAETVWVAVPSCNTKIGAPFVTTSGATITPTTVPQRTLTNASDWPYPLPTPPTSSSCTTGSVTINPAWVTTHPTHGVYCYTGTITLGMPSGTTVSGYEFVSLGTAGNTIKTGTAGGKYVGYGEDKLLFYAPNGGLAFTQGITVEGIILAPKGTVTMTGAGTTQTGFIEALNVVLTNSNTTFIGTGPGPSGGDVSLDE